MTTPPTGTTAATSRAPHAADAPHVVRVRLFAGAAAAAGADETLVQVAPAVGGTPVVADLRTALGRDHPALVPVLEVATVLVDGVAAPDTSPLPPGEALAGGPPVVDVLPPFAGG